MQEVETVVNPYYDLYCEEVEKNERLTKKVEKLEAENKSLKNRVDYLETNLAAIVQKHVEAAVAQVSAEYEKKIEKLENKVTSLQAIINQDANTTGKPTSQTPIDKDKRVPNSREKTSNKIGGQPGHAKHKLAAFSDEEVTEHICHSEMECPFCHVPMEPSDQEITRDELDFEIIIKKKRHHFGPGHCPKCGYQSEKPPVPPHLHGENQYGPFTQATILSLYNEGCVSMSRTRGLIEGMTNGEVSPSEGYIAKTQKRVAGGLELFISQLKLAILALAIVHWDDTVIHIAKKRACLRFYGDEMLALFVAHARKNKEGIDKDGLFAAFGPETTLVHDHLLVNYREEYDFQNAECCQHLIRDLKKVSNHLGHKWANGLIGCLVQGNNDRNDKKELDAVAIFRDYDKFVWEGYIENGSEKEGAYYKDKELALLNRLKKFKENYLMWVVNQEVPFTNNASERRLRGIKTKMKVSGQFQNIANAEYYATIRSYIETGKRHGMNPVSLLERAARGQFYTLEAMREFAKDHD